MKQTRKLSVLIPTYNEEDIIEGAIKSVQWADEVVVVDSFSTDKTIKIAKSLGAKVIQHKYEYAAKQKNWAIPKMTHEWILVLDSDEIITDALRKNIEKFLESNEIEKYDGLAMARKHYFFGKFLRWGGRYPLRNIRLFRKACRYEDRDVHEHVLLQKKRIKKIDGDILHFSDRTWSQFFEKFSRYSHYQANYMLKISENGIKINWHELFINSIYAKSVIKDFWHFLPGASFLRFFYMYILRWGFLDGRAGIVIAILYAMQDFVSKTRYLELKKQQPVLRKSIQQMVIRFAVKIRALGEVYPLQQPTVISSKNFIF